jgi:hypothetical protein
MPTGMRPPAPMPLGSGSPFGGVGSVLRTMHHENSRAKSIPAIPTYGDIEGRQLAGGKGGYLGGLEKPNAVRNRTAADRKEEIMDHAQHTRIVSFIWGIADDVLRDLYVRGKYRDVILPMTVLRRLDAVLEPTKQDVLALKTTLDKQGIVNQDEALRAAAKQAFYNTSQFTLRDLKNRSNAQTLQADFLDYLDGFSPNVQEILINFSFRIQVPKLVKADALGYLIEKYLDPTINFSPKPVGLARAGQPCHGHHLRGAGAQVQRGEQRGGR